MMRIPCLTSTGLAAAVFACALGAASIGCGRSLQPEQEEISKIDRVEVYFRRFELLSFVGYDEKTLVKNAEAKIVLENSEQIESFFDQLPRKCAKPVSPAPKLTDLFLLVRSYSGNALTEKWTFSRFHYLTSKGVGPCPLIESDRVRIAHAISGFASTE
jgi:hypothetical protein